VLKAADLIGQRAAAQDLLRDEKMTAVSQTVGKLALDWSLGKLGYARDDLRDVKVRHAVFSFAAQFAREQWPEVVKWIDQNNNGQIDWLEATQAGGLPPVEHVAKAPAAV
jgi:hypothetical protein